MRFPLLGSSLLVLLAAGAPTVRAADDVERHLERSWQHLVRQRDDLGVREVMGFALEAAGRDVRREQVTQAIDLLTRFQDRSDDSPTRGNFRWRWDDDKVHDLNAVEFVVARGALVQSRFAGRLEPAAQQHLRELLERAGPAALAHRVPVDYTNIYLLKCWNLIALGEVLSRAPWADEGYRLLAAWIDHTRQVGIVEYSSPTYYGVDLDALGLIARFAARPEGRRMGLAGLRYVWTEIAANWYEPGKRLGGAHSRDYDYLTGHGELDRHLARVGWLDAPAPDTIFDQLCAWSPPAELRALSLRTPRHIAQRWGAQPGHWAQQYVGRNFSLGVAGATYGNMDKPLAVNLPGGPKTPIVSFFLDGRDDPYGRKKIATGSGHDKSLHLMPLVASAMRDQDVLLLAGDDDQTRKATKTAKQLTCLRSHVLFPKAAEVWIDDRRETFASSETEIELESASALFLRTGDVVLGIRIPLAQTTRGQPAKVAIVDDGRPWGARRLTCFLSNERPKGEALVAVWMRAAEGLDEDGFVRFRKEFRAAKCRAEKLEHGVRVEAGADERRLRVDLDLKTHESMGDQPPFGPLVVDGRDLGSEALELRD